MSQNSSHGSRSLQLLSLVTAAWLGIVITPCVAVAANPSVLAAVSTQQIEVDCHGAHSNLQPGDTESCCGSFMVAGKEGPKRQRVDLAAINAPMVSNTPNKSVPSYVQWARPLQVDDDGPPVYLTTQRLRI